MRQYGELKQCYVDGYDLCGTQTLTNGQDVIERLPHAKIYPYAGDLYTSCCGQTFIIRSWR